MSALRDILVSHIKQSGPIDVGQFMSFALSHPEHGYYMKQDPFGRAGDFITAPEVSQMFGEVLGAWVAHHWMQRGSPERFAFVELGPGRGTLMADMLRGTLKVKGFHDALGVHLVETSPFLREAQDKALSGYEVHWHDGLDGLPLDVPLIVIANEFFDALPIRQMLYQGGGWHERVVGIDEAGELSFGLQTCAKELWPKFGAPRNGDMYEFSPVRESVMDVLARRILDQGGAAVIVDYGHTKSGFGDTLQAVFKHSYSDVLAEVGNADLSSHVDFEVLQNCASDCGAVVDGVVEQGAFLMSLGIVQRAEFLAQSADCEQKRAQIEKDLHRLVKPDEMGRLFKVLGIHYGGAGQLAGF